MPAFDLLGPETPRSPVLLAVPHAGRIYPDEVVARARVPMNRLRALEDRYADRLVMQAVAEGHTAIVARIARAAIDLNRDQREIDPAMMEEGMQPEALLLTGKVRAGLGLFPRRLPACGELWRGRMSRAEADSRIAGIYQPYHSAIAERLQATVAVFGAAVLLDCHSMPPLPVRQPGGPVRVVIGDRFGAGASAALVDLVLAMIEGAGLRAARNHPYAGGHSIDRHGRPHRNIHAIQIEYDRSLYLDAALESPAAGLGDCARLLAGIAAQLGASLYPGLSVAAE